MAKQLFKNKEKKKKKDKQNNFSAKLKGDNIVIKKDGCRSLFNGKITDKSIKTILVHLGRGIYMSVPYKTYKDLNSIAFIYVNDALQEYDYCDDEYFTHRQYAKTLFTPKDILKYYYEQYWRKRIFCGELPEIWDSLFQFKYKKIRIAFKDGTKKKMSISKFTRIYLRGVFL